MALVLLMLLLLVEPPRIFASGLLEHEKACGTYHISQSDDPSHELFYIDGKVVDRYFFCKVLRDHHERNCFLTDTVRKQYCRILDSLPFLEGRKSLKTVVGEGYSGIAYHRTSQNGGDNAKNSLLEPKMVAMAVPAFFLLCCALLCPCFQARKKDTGHTVLSKEPNSSERLFALYIYFSCFCAFLTPLRL